MNDTVPRQGCLSDQPWGGGRVRVRDKTRETRASDSVTGTGWTDQ